MLTVARRTRKRQLLLRAALDLVFQQAGEELDVRPLPLDRLAVAGVQGLQHPGQAQLLELGGELVHQFHRRPPSKSPKSSVALRMKVCAGAGCGHGWVQRLLLLAVLQDALDRHIGRVAEAQGAVTGGFQALVVVLLAQLEQPAHRAQPIHDGVGEQGVHDLRRGRTNILGHGQAGGRSPYSPSSFSGGRWSGWVMRSPACCARSWVATSS